MADRTDPTLLADVRPIVWSSGGGVQSTAIAVLIAQGRLPIPEVAVIADTGREQSAVWAYLHEHVQPYLRDKADLTVHIAGHDLATVDLHTNSGRLLIPAFTATGKLPTFCSVEWKQRVVRRYLRGLGYGPSRPLTLWLGISRDEAHRMKPADVEWIDHAYPLIDLVSMSRRECRALVLDAGLPAPPRSSCWMCPHHTDAEWREIRDHAPHDWQLAVALEASIRQRDPGVWLHRARRPLSEVVLSRRQGSLFDGCGGDCYV